MEMKRKLFIWTTVCFLIWSLSVPGFSVFAAETAHLESDLYHYSYQGDALKTSDHFLPFNGGTKILQESRFAIVTMQQISLKW